MPMDRDGTLLLVEDEDLLRSLVSQFLRGSGFDVVEAGDGREALRRIEEDGPFDLALVDLNLPHYSGVDVCRRLLGRWPGHRVIICSAAIVGEQERALQGLGIDHFLTKPYHPETLLEQVARRLTAAA
jgi:DNA-binding response OmpR family regulator